MIIRYLGYLRRYRGPRRKNGRNYGRRNNRPETTEHPRVDKLRERIQTRAELSIELPSVEDNEESRFLLLLLLLSRCSQKNCGSLRIGTVSGEFNPLSCETSLLLFLFFPFVPVGFASVDLCFTFFDLSTRTIERCK